MNVRVSYNHMCCVPPNHISKIRIFGPPKRAYIIRTCSVMIFWRNFFCSYQNIRIKPAKRTKANAITSFAELRFVQSIGTIFETACLQFVTSQFQSRLSFLKTLPGNEWLLPKWSKANWYCFISLIIVCIYTPE